jgi:hypothetical protein
MDFLLLNPITYKTKNEIDQRIVLLGGGGGGGCRCIAPWDD